MQLDYDYNNELSTGDTHVYDCTPINICLVGSRGVGKTSLLASMFQEVKKKKLSLFYIDKNDLGKKTESILSQAHLHMLEMIDDTKEGELTESLGIAGSTDERIYEFLGISQVKDTDFISLSQNKRFRFRFHFTDIPGTWYQPEATEKQTRDANRILTAADASFIAVDAPALMSGAAANIRFNKPDCIENWYKRNLCKLKDNKHSVIIVLARCEKFWAQKKDMIKRVRETYCNLLSTLQQEGIRVCVTWVKTLGGLEFAGWTRNGSEKIHQFKRVGNYCPENCATPLQLALRFSLLNAVDNMEQQIAASLLKRITSKLGLSNEEWVIAAAQNLIRTLWDGLHAGSDDTYITLTNERQPYNGATRKLLEQLNAIMQSYHS